MALPVEVKVARFLEVVAEGEVAVVRVVEVLVDGEVESTGRKRRSNSIEIIIFISLQQLASVPFHSLLSRHSRTTSPPVASRSPA